MLSLEEQVSVKKCFSKLDILTVYDQYILECIMCVTTFKLNKLNLRSDIHTYQTRNRNNIDLSQHKLSFFTKKATYMGSKFLNHLPFNVKSKISENNFRSVIKKYLLKRTCYSLEEFFASMG